jgi:hypothetical protein
MLNLLFGISDAQVPNAMTPEAGACAAADMGLDMIEVSASRYAGEIS